MSLQEERWAPQAVCLDGSGGARRLDGEALGSWQPGNGPLWVDLDEAGERDRAWLADASGLQEDHVAQFLRNDVWSRVRSPDADQLLVVMRVPDMRPEAREDAPEIMRLWIEPHRVITMAPATDPYLRGVKKQLDEGRGPMSPGGLLLLVIELMASALADQILQIFRPAVVDLELSLEEKDSAAASSFDRLRRLRRHVSELQRYAAPHRALLLRLRSFDLVWLMAGEEADWRAVIDYFDEASRALDALADHVKALQDSQSHRVSEQMNRRVYMLTVVSTVILPLSLIASLFGGNISTVNGNILGAAHPLWFIGISIGLAVLGWAAYALFRRLGFL